MPHGVGEGGEVVGQVLAVLHLEGHALAAGGRGGGGRLLGAGAADSARLRGEAVVLVGELGAGHGVANAAAAAALGGGAQVGPGVGRGGPDPGAGGAAASEAVLAQAGRGQGRRALCEGKEERKNKKLRSLSYNVFVCSCTYSRPQFSLFVSGNCPYILELT